MMEHEKQSFHLWHNVESLRQIFNTLFSEFFFSERILSKHLCPLLQDVEILGIFIIQLHSL